MIGLGAPERYLGRGFQKVLRARFDRVRIRVQQLGPDIYRKKNIISRYIRQDRTWSGYKPVRKIVYKDIHPVRQNVVRIYTGKKDSI